VRADLVLEHAAHAVRVPGGALAEPDSPYNLPDGTLNPCLQCDRDESGEVFKAVAGRTRRDTGVPNAICRAARQRRGLRRRRLREVALGG
jgi:hypothetical protein